MRDELSRLNQRVGFLVEFVVEDMVEPRFLSHGIDISLLKRKPFHQPRRFPKIAAARAARAVDFAGNRLRKERTEQYVLVEARHKTIRLVLSLSEGGSPRN